MSKKKSYKFNKNKYHHYTSKGASLHDAHSDYAAYHEANHHSFFNMNNAAGLFKLVIIGAIILAVIVLLSPLMKFLKNLIGAGNSAVDTFHDLTEMCKRYGTCVTNDSTKNPNAGISGVCDDQGAPAKTGKTCTAWPTSDKAVPDEPAPPAPCGSTINNWCKAGLAGWLFAAWIVPAMAWMYEKWKERKKDEPGKQGDNLDAMNAGGNEELANEIIQNTTEAAVASDSNTAAQDRTVGQLQDRMEKLQDIKITEGGPASNLGIADIHMYEPARFSASERAWTFKPKDNNTRVSANSGLPCATLPSTCESEGEIGARDYGVKKVCGWTTDDGETYYYDAKKRREQMSPEMEDAFHEAYIKNFANTKTERVCIQQWSEKALEIYDKNILEKEKAATEAADSAITAAEKEAANRDLARAVEQKGAAEGVVKDGAKYQEEQREHINERMDKVFDDFKKRAEHME